MRHAPSAALAALFAALVTTGCHRTEPTAWSGYVEGEYVYVAAPVGGQLQQLDVRRGQAVKRGAPLFTLESDAEQAARDEAAARAEAAAAQARDATKGRRAPELAVTQAQLAQAQAAARLAGDELARQRALQRQGFVSAARGDEAQSALDQAHQRVAELQAALQVGRLPAREDERAAAEATATAAEQALKQGEWRTRQKQQAAPADAQVSDVFFRLGEYVAPGQPVLSLLPPGQTKARFFVPEADIGRIAIGQAVSLQCDGCGAPIAARIDFIATQPEYTPPVIYSNAQRSRLVFMVEARPSVADGTKLKPGQPLDVKSAS
jgi:HlyD family secretion protein